MLNLKTIVFILFFSKCLFGYSQYWETGVYLGGSNYAGDLVDGTISLKETHPTFGAIVRYNINQWVTLKGDIYHGTISGKDANSSKFVREQRNLSFKSSVLDIGLQPEFNLRGYKSGHNYYNSSPYVFFGISIFRFNPKAYYNGKWYALQPLCTEGQGTTKYNDREKYALTQVAIPFGFGWKYALNRNWNLGMELSARKTFTDYLDDVSSSYVPYDIILAQYGDISAALSNRTGEVDPYQREPFDASVDRGNSTTNDWYYFAGFWVTYSILPNACYRF